MISPYRLILGDALEVLKGLEPGSVDAVICDPPYGTGWARTARGSEQGSFVGEREQPEWDVWSIDWLDEAKRIAKGLAFLLPRSRLEDAFRALPGARVAFYVKSNPRPNGPTVEPVLCWGEIRTPAWDLTAYNGDTTFHPCQKPLSVMRWMLRGVEEGGTVLDPFMGSGTTGVACAEEGFRFIGVEREPRYFEIAEKRIRQAYSQGRLFA